MTDQPEILKICYKTSRWVKQSENNIAASLTWAADPNKIMARCLQTETCGWLIRALSRDNIYCTCCTCCNTENYKGFLWRVIEDFSLDIIDATKSFDTISCPLFGNAIQATEQRPMLYPFPSYLKLHLAYLPNFFSIWTRVLNHNKYVEIKQFSKVDI